MKWKETLHLIANKALHGMAESLMLWHQELKSVSEAQDFTLNLCNPCAANKKVNGSWMMIAWHVDDLKISHKDKDVSEGADEVSD